MKLNSGVRLLLAVAAVAALGAVLWSASRVGEETGGSGSFPLAVVGPDGEIFNGTVEARDATALSVLQAAGKRDGFEVEVEEFPAYGSCGSYVRSVDGHEEEGTAGWVYEMLLDDGWWRPPRGSACQPLEDGQPLRWLWVEHE